MEIPYYLSSYAILNTSRLAGCITQTKQHPVGTKFTQLIVHQAAMGEASAWQLAVSTSPHCLPGRVAELNVCVRMSIMKTLKQT